MKSGTTDQIRTTAAARDSFGQSLQKNGESSPHRFGESKCCCGGKVRTRIAVVVRAVAAKGNARDGGPAIYRHHAAGTKKKQSQNRADRNAAWAGAGGTPPHTTRITRTRGKPPCQSRKGLVAVINAPDTGNATREGHGPKALGVTCDAP
jgi:hypothetical protein